MGIATASRTSESRQRKALPTVPHPKLELLETRIALTLRYAAAIILWRRSFPSFGRGFDSHRPLHKSNDDSVDLTRQ